MASKGRNHVDDIIEAHTLCERPLGRPLDHRTVGHRVGERNAQLDDVSAGTWDDPGGSPLVLVGLSSTVMSHEEELLQRAAEALGRLPVRGLVTTGPAVNPAAIRAPANVSVRRWVRHADVLPSCSAVLTHGGPAP